MEKLLPKEVSRMFISRLDLPISCIPTSYIIHYRFLSSPIQKPHLKSLQISIEMMILSCFVVFVETILVSSSFFKSSASATHKFDATGTLQK